MGNISAIAVGVVAFLVVLAAGNIVGAVIFGIVMFAMSYGVFAWRPEEKRQMREASAPPLTPLTENKDSAMRSKLSAQERAVANSFALQLAQLGLGETEALAFASQLVAGVISELRPQGIDLFKLTQGNEYAAREAFTTPRLAAGLTHEDIRFHWNRPLLIVFCEAKMREMINFTLVDIARQQGRNLVEAGNEYKKKFPRYGDPQLWDPAEKFNQGLRSQDADIYQEFAARVDSWQRRVGESAVAKAIAAHGTMNAAIRNLVAGRQL